MPKPGRPAFPKAEQNRPPRNSSTSSKPAVPCRKLLQKNRRTPSGDEAADARTGAWSSNVDADEADHQRQIARAGEERALTSRAPSSARPCDVGREAVQLFELIEAALRRARRSPVLRRLLVSRKNSPAGLMRAPTPIVSCGEAVPLFVRESSESRRSCCSDSEQFDDRVSSRPSTTSCATFFAGEFLICSRLLRGFAIDVDGAFAAECASGASPTGRRPTRRARAPPLASTGTWRRFELRSDQLAQDVGQLWQSSRRPPGRCRSIRRSSSHRGRAARSR
jgi:hypothetical protein